VSGAPAYRVDRTSQINQERGVRGFVFGINSIALHRMSASFPPVLPPLTEHPEGPRAGRYRHYKGNPYQVLGVARHSETSEELVVYRMLYGDYSLWIRPRVMFMETVEVNGQLQPRFTYVGPE
jgi:Protein of unknown function (DUF1653)